MRSSRWCRSIEPSVGLQAATPVPAARPPAAERVTQAGFGLLESLRGRHFPQFAQSGPRERAVAAAPKAHFRSGLSNRVANPTRTRDHRDHNFAWLAARGVTIGRGRVPTRLVTSPRTRHESRLVTDCCHNVATTKPTEVRNGSALARTGRLVVGLGGCLLRPFEPLTKLLVPPKLLAGRSA